LHWLQIEVKLITAGAYPSDVGDAIDGQLEGAEEGEEARQIQHMIYNLMVMLFHFCYI
jgi:hypothetical protein